MTLASNKIEIGAGLTHVLPDPRSGAHDDSFPAGTWGCKSLYMRFGNISDIYPTMTGMGGWRDSLEIVVYQSVVPPLGRGVERDGRGYLMNDGLYNKYVRR